MRSSVCAINAASGENFNMNFPDYEQLSSHHACLLVLIRGVGPNKPKSLQKVFERIQKVSNVKIKDSSGQVRDLFVRYVRDHAVENNEWGDFQTHRRVVGLITVGKFESQGELNELCRIHESLKVKYTSTLYDTRSILFAPQNIDNDVNDENAAVENEKSMNGSENVPTGFKLDDSEMKILNDNNIVMPTIFKSRGFFYAENNACSNLESRITDFIHSLFWILESKRLDRTKEKFDKVALLLAPFEKKDFVGLDMESRVNKKRIMGRVTKNLADLTLQCGLVGESLNYYYAAAETLKSIGDSLWYGSALEGICSCTSVILYPHLRHSIDLQRNISLQGNHLDPVKKNPHRASDGSKHVLQSRKFDLKISLERAYSSKDSSPTSSSDSSNSTSNQSSDNSATSPSSTNDSDSSNSNKPVHNQIPSNMLHPDEITGKYREAIINYSKYRMAGIIETEAALKAARICIEQNKNLDVAMFLQNVLYINLNMNEQERVRRFETLTELYQQIGYHRKASFCQRLAAWRHIAQSNTNPDWAESYRLMLDSFRGQKLSLDPNEVLMTNQGWPCLQIDLLQQLVGTARRLNQSALATRHMTFLLQTQWNHLSSQEQKEMCLQLQSLSAQCEGSPVPLFLENGNVIPPANLTDLPYCSSFRLKKLPSHLQAVKLKTLKKDCSPFLFTPIHFNQSIDRRTAKDKKLDSNVDFLWVLNVKSEVEVKFQNPLPFDLQVNDMRLLSDGIVFESIPESVSLSPNACSSIILSGTPLEVGELELNGYSTHTLGIKSNCRLKLMADRDFPSNFKVNVISALPLLSLTTSMPSLPIVNSEDFVCSARACLYNGESRNCVVTFSNHSDVEISYLEIELQSSLDTKTRRRVIRYDTLEIEKNLPLLPGKSFDFNVEIYGDAEFIGSSPIPPSPHLIATDGPSSLSGINSLISGGVQSVPSRVNSPILRNNEQNSSFRSSTTTASGTINSGHSSLATVSLGTLINGHQARVIDVQLKFKYSGGNAQVEGYCRQCSLLINIELSPSVHITNWDVLPSEIASEFYLVLDVANLTQQEVSLNYCQDKNILIEPKESCRVPIPVQRCRSTDQSEQPEQKISDVETNYSGYYNSSDVDSSERLCSEHIADSVVLKYHLLNSDTTGIATLRGIALSSTMLDLITESPIQWNVRINNIQITPQSEVTVNCGSTMTIDVALSNNQAAPLSNLILSVQFYQDYQNGVQNYRLETRACMTGPNFTVIPQLNRNEPTSFLFSAIFFTRGRYKVDLQCKNDSKIGHQSLSVTPHHDTHHTYKFIPAIEITVI